MRKLWRFVAVILIAVTVSFIDLYWFMSVFVYAAEEPFVYIVCSAVIFALSLSAVRDTRLELIVIAVFSCIHFWIYGVLHYTVRELPGAIVLAARVALIVSIKVLIVAAAARLRGTRRTSDSAQ